MKLHYLSLIPFLSLVAFCPSAHADTFGSGANAFDIEFVTIGDAGNAADIETGPAPHQGAVPYTYRIGKFEISELMIDKANAITDLAGDPLGITHDGRGPNKPVTSVSWFEAAEFVNWLNTSTGLSPAYKFVDKFDGRGNVIGSEFALWQPSDPGYNPTNLFRNANARYLLPSVDEWYKAAFYDPATDTWFDYPTIDGLPPTPVLSGSDPGTAVFRQGPLIPTGPADIILAGGLSAFDTMAQGGNVSEWDEVDVDLINDNPVSRRGRRGGNWDSFSFSLSSSSRVSSLPGGGLNSIGFRVVHIPEPHSLLLLCLGGLGALGLRARITPTESLRIYIC